MHARNQKPIYLTLVKKSLDVYKLCIARGNAILGRHRFPLINSVNFLIV